MPCIQTKVNVSIAPNVKESIKDKFGKAITNIPGKTETWLMLTFEENSSIYFQGDGSQPAAFVEVKIFGKAYNYSYDKMTVAITEILNQELDIPTSRIYVKYEETQHWGWNGINF